MCLSRLMSDSEKAAFLSTLPETIPVYKLVIFHKEGKDPGRGYFTTPYSSSLVEVGTLTADAISLCISPFVTYESGFHSFLSVVDIESWITATPVQDEYILEASVQKSDITYVGYQNNWVCIVSSKITYSKLPEVR